MKLLGILVWALLLTTIQGYKGWYSYTPVKELKRKKH